MTMTAPRKIMLATDLTPAGDRAFDRAVELAQEWDADLIVLHVVESNAARPWGIDRRMHNVEPEMDRLLRAAKTEGLAQEIALCANLRIVRAALLRFTIRETGEAQRVADSEALRELGIEIELAALPHPPAEERARTGKPSQKPSLEEAGKPPIPAPSTEPRTAVPSGQHQPVPVTGEEQLEETPSALVQAAMTTLAAFLVGVVGSIIIARGERTRPIVKKRN